MAVRDSAVIPPPPDGFHIVGDPTVPPPGFQLVPAQAQPAAEVPDTLIRAGHGVDRTLGALKQMYLMATDPTAADAYTAQLNDEEARYQRGMQAGAAQQAADPTVLQRTHDVLQSAFPLAGLFTSGVDYQGADIPSIAASAAIQAPLMLLPGGQSVPARAALGALQGGISGLVSNPTEEGTAWGKVKQGAEGTALGFGIPLVADAAAPLASALRSRVLGRTAPADALAPDVLERMNAMQDVGVVPTKAQITRNPQDWYAEQELGKAEGPAKDAFIARGQANNQALADALAGIQSRSVSPYDAAEAARKAVAAYEKDARSVAGGTYRAAENAPGADALFPGQAFFDTASPILSEFEDAIPGAVQKRLAELQAGLTPAAAPARRVVAAVDSSKDDVITAIRKFGGINPDDEAVGSLAKANPFPPSPMYGPVWRQPAAYGSTGSNTAVGHSLDTMSQRLHTAGYIDEANPDLVMDKIADSTMTGPQYSAFFDHEARADPLASAIQQLTDQLGARNVAASTPASRDFTVGEASKLYQLINSRMGTASGAAAPAGRQLKSALMDAGLAAPESTPAMQIFKDATQQYRALNQAIEPAPLKSLSSLSKNADEAPANYLQTKILNGKPGEVAQSLEFMRQNHPQAAVDVHDAVVGWLQGQATAANDRFSGVAFGKALDKLGPERVAAIFEPGEVKTLEKLRTASNAATVEPDLTGVNKSNTTSALFNMLRKGSDSIATVAGTALGEHFGSPIVGAVTGAAANKIAQALAQRRMAAQMDALLNPSTADLIAGPTMAAQQRRAMAAALSRMNPIFTLPAVSRATSASNAP